MHGASPLHALWTDEIGIPASGRSFSYPYGQKASTGLSGAKYSTSGIHLHDKIVVYAPDKYPVVHSSPVEVSTSWYGVDSLLHNMGSISGRALSLKGALRR